MNIKSILFLLCFAILIIVSCAIPKYYLITDSVNSIKDRDIKIVKVDTLKFSDGNMFKVWYK